MSLTVVNYIMTYITAKVFVCHFQIFSKICKSLTSVSFNIGAYRFLFDYVMISGIRKIHHLWLTVLTKYIFTFFNAINHSGDAAYSCNTIAFRKKWGMRKRKGSGGCAQLVNVMFMPTELPL